MIWEGVRTGVVLFGDREILILGYLWNERRVVWGIYTFI